VPHPRLHQRRFALEPLLELDPHSIIPGRGRAADCLAALAHATDQAVERLEDPKETPP
jgi:2-amino-4-hydroxy-6-hydroxymethyldihydropteridine diphosphokinase